MSYILIVFLLICSAFFSSTEIAYASANKSRLRKAAESGSKNGIWALHISDHYDKALCTILIGNNLVNIASSSVATVIAMQLVGNAGVAVATAVMTVLLLIFGEILPKQLAGATYKRGARKILLLAGCFAHKHQICRFIARAEHAVGAGLRKGAGGTAFTGFLQYFPIHNFPPKRKLFAIL